MKDQILFLPSLVIFISVAASCLWLFEANIYIKLERKGTLAKAIKHKQFNLKLSLLSYHIGDCRCYIY